MPDRRQFLVSLVQQSLAFPFLHRLQLPLLTEEGNSSKHHFASRILAPETEMPDGKRLPFGWNAFAVMPQEEEPVLLEFKPANFKYEEMRLRLCSVIDARENILIGVYLGRSNRLIGTLDIRFPAVIQPYDLFIPEDFHRQVFSKGISLKMLRGETTLWFLGPEGQENLPNHALRAQLLLSNQQASEAVFLDHFYSLNPAQQFGWMEGCVLDGLWAMYQKTKDKRAKTAIYQHLDLFFDQNQKLDYEDPRSEPVYNSIYGVECPLPLAVVAQLDPVHPVLALFAKYCRDSLKNASYIGGKYLSTEGCYTLAYPMLQTALALDDSELAEAAVRELEVRSQKLFIEGNIYQRGNLNSEPAFENWARGVAWYMLGMVKSLNLLRQHPELMSSGKTGYLQEKLVEAVDLALNFQNPQGLWYCFLKEPETEVETAGSAGIAAALTLAGNFGLTDRPVKAAAEKTRQAILKFLTPDGFVTGTAQSNKGGEELQRSGYRVISSYASGLYAQLLAALDS
jgi:rhamnogalacturonyl hydrolase YesR